MLCFTILLIAVVVGNAEELQVKAEDLAPVKESRAIGWSPAKITQYPVIVQVTRDFQYVCVGTLITQKHVLSVAHRIVNNKEDVIDNPDIYAIRMGTEEAYRGNVINIVRKITIHENFNEKSRDNDLAIFMMYDAAPLGPTIGIASLPVQGAEITDSTKLISIGYGRITNPAGDMVLYDLSFQRLNVSECNSGTMTAAENIPDTNNVICAKPLGNVTNLCLDDDGAPLVFNNVVVGMTVSISGCWVPENPRYYARIASYRSWIEKTVAAM